MPTWEVRGPYRAVIAAPVDRPHNFANARLIAAAPELLEVLKNVNKIISEAAMTGFNWQDGDWAERLFQSQQATSAAIRRATQP